MKVDRVYGAGLLCSLFREQLSRPYAVDPPSRERASPCRVKVEHPTV